MKKMKKIMALLLTAVMVMGMSLTTFAAPGDETSVTITVRDEEGNPLVIAPEAGSMKYVQVIKPDSTTRTGWAFIKESYANAYIDAFGINGDDANEKAQKAIDKLILDDGKSAEIAKALNTISAMDSEFAVMEKNPLTVNSAGIYVIKASQTGYTYTNMAAYVGFGLVSNDTYPELTSTDITAKRASVDISKTVTDSDKVVAIGDILTYTVETTVPYVDPTKAKDTKFEIWDEISGADYYFEGEGSHFSVTVGDFETVSAKPVIDPKTNNKFTIDLSELINDANSNAGKKVLIVYTAKVNSVNIENKVGSNVNGGIIDEGNVTVYTGSIMLTKYNEDRKEKLEGAGFEVRKDNNKEALKFTQISEGHYTYNPEGIVTEVFTGPDGTLVLTGLDLGTYNFKEKTAPEGYHIKNDPSGVDAIATLKLDEGETEAKATITAETDLTNTKLSSLPSTGGIGTTIFTIAGCVIMIAAAGMFFANRKKDEK